MINDKHTGAGGKAACSGFVLRAIPPRRASAAGFCIPPRKKAGERRRFLCAAAQKKLYKPARMLYNRTRARAHGRFVRYGAANSGALAKLAIALHWQCRDHRFESGKLHQMQPPQYGCKKARNRGPFCSPRAFFPPPLRQAARRSPPVGREGGGGGQRYGGGSVPPVLRPAASTAGRSEKLQFVCDSMQTCLHGIP